jgi:transcriptional regulator with XRE-family HTH domain
MSVGRIFAILFNIKEQRIHLAYSQSHVARKLSISQNAYCKIENGQTSLSVERLIQIADILQTEPERLLTMDGVVPILV